ncbi:MAG: hypothetical protein IKY44_04245, partial [Clostridia bacterium]|nr:hypothetical protein [Clostridia bacterium]
LRRKKKDVEEPTEGETASIEAPQDENIPADEQTAPVAEGEEAPADATPVTEEAPTADEVNIEPNNDGVSKTPKQPKDSPAENGIAYNTEDDRVDYTTFATKRSPYHERYYLLYGGESELAFIDSSATLKYLGALCGHRNPLKQARNGKKVAELIETTYKPGKPDARYCDFCGTEIYGVEYETLVDGRNRCMHCSRTAVKTGEEFRKLFEDVKRNMESFFSIRINAGIKVEMVNSKTLHRRLGENFVPTPKSDGRILGVAIHDRNGFTIMVENGAPRMSTMLVCAHELTHIWQYLNWNKKELRKKYGRKLLPQIYEGMSKWVEVQYAYLVNEPAVAKREEIITSYRQDEYGQGFLRYRANYPFSLGTVITKPTPFMYPQTPLKEEFCGAFEVQMPTDGVNPGDIENTRPTDDKPISTGAIEGPIDRNTGTLNMYAYSTLTSSEKAVYNDILSAITSFSPMISGFSAPVTEPQIKKIVDYVYRDHPEIFWFQYGATIYYNEATLDVSRVELSYCMTPDEAKNRQEKIEAAIKPFLTSITDGMSDYEVVLHIYENIISLVDYDTIGLERQKKSDAVNPNVPDDLRSIYGVFVNRKAVCAGYAKAFQYLLNACGIECCYVTSATHAWNIVRLEGDYYHVDVTWGDGSNTKKEKSQIDAIMYDCFCLTTEEITRLSEHTPESILPLPACTATKCNYHRRHGLFLEAYNLDRIRTIVCESVKLNKLDISFKFGSAAAYNEAKQDLINKGKFRDAIQLAALRADVRLGTAYTYMSFDDRWTMMFRITKM